MNHKITTGVALVGLLSSWNVLADQHCNDPVADWQTTEALTQQLGQSGWQVHKIKVDDGCYEVRGLDRKGNAVEATFYPASLKVRDLDVDFSPTADSSDYFPKAK